MDAHRINSARRAKIQESLKPSQAHGVRAVRHSRRHELGPPGEGLHVLQVTIGGVGGQKGGLLPVVGLVEGHEVRGAGVDGCRSCCLPVNGVLLSQRPEHGHVLDARRHGFRRRRAPVEGPGDLVLGSEG